MTFMTLKGVNWWHYRFRHRASETRQSRFLLFRSANRLIKNLFWRNTQ